MPVGALPPQLAALNRTFLNVVELTVRAALDQSREHVYQAALLDPNTAATLTTRRSSRCATSCSTPTETCCLRRSPGDWTGAWREMTMRAHGLRSRSAQAAACAVAVAATAGWSAAPASARPSARAQSARAQSAGAQSAGPVAGAVGRAQSAGAQSAGASAGAQSAAQSGPRRREHSRPCAPRPAADRRVATGRLRVSAAGLTWQLPRLPRGQRLLSFEVGYGWQRCLPRAGTA